VHAQGQQLVSYLQHAPLDMAYRLASSDWCYVFTPVHGQPRLLASAHAGMADNFKAANQGASIGNRL